MWGVCQSSRAQEALSTSVHTPSTALGAVLGLGRSLGGQVSPVRRTLAQVASLTRRTPWGGPPPPHPTEKVSMLPARSSRTSNLSPHLEIRV